MKKKEVHTFYNFQFKHTAVRITNHAEIQASHVAEALEIHPIMLYRWRQEMRDGRIEDNDKEARSINELMEAQKKIKKLERDCARLRAENIVLKKAERLFPEKK
jgi:transposase-like protein